MRALLALSLASAAVTVGAGSAWAAEAKPVAVYGIELEVADDRERLLVFAAEALSPVLEQTDAETLVVRLPGAVLDESAPRKVVPRLAGTVIEVLAVEHLEQGRAPEVRLLVRRAERATPEILQRGATLALDFPPPERTRGEELVFDFEQVDLAELVETIARATGESIMFDDSLTGRVTVALAQPVTRSEALALLDSVLLLEGFAAVPTPGGVRRVLPIDGARERAPWQGDAGPDSEAPVATLLRLRSASAGAVISSLGPWIGKGLLAMVHTPSNAIVLAGSERRLHGVMMLARALDRAAEERLVVRRLRHRSADAVADMLKAALETAPLADRVQVWAHQESNAIVLRGRPERMVELRAWLARIDRQPEGRGELRVRRVRYADPEALASTLQAITGGAPAGEATPAAAAPVLRSGLFGVGVDGPTHSLLIRAEPEVHAAIDDLLDELDRPAPRIHVEVTVVEIETDTSLSLGFDAFLPLTEPKKPGDAIASIFSNPSGGGLLEPGQGAGTQFAARYTREPLLIPIVDEAGNPDTLLVPRESFVITANEATVKTRVLLKPHLLLLSGEEHEIFVGDNVPIPVAATSEGANPLQVQQNIERQDVGVRLRVRPTLGQRGRVRLHLELDATRVQRLATLLAGESGPVLEQRRLSTTVLLDDDEIAVIGTAVLPRVEEIEVGAPYLKDVPGLGYLFRRSDRRQRNAQLVIAAQARIHESPNDEMVESIRRRLGFERVLARVAPLAAEKETRWALRVSTRSRLDDAEAIAQSFAAQGDDARVVSWEWEGRERHDVDLVGFADAAEAAAASRRVREAGFTPELVVVPARGASRLPGP